MANILFISHMFPNERDFAYGKVIFEQAQSLKHMHKIIVICPVPYVPPFFKYIKKRYAFLKKIKRKAYIKGIKVYYPRFIVFGSFLFCHTGFSMYLGIKKIAKKLNKKYQFDLIHSHFIIPDGHAAAKLSRKLKIPYIITLQATDLNYTIYKCHKKIEKACLKADKIISPTPILAERIKYFINKKINVIGYGIDEQKVIQKAPIILKQKYQGKIIILSICRLIKSKGIEDCIKAVYLLKDKYPNMLYLIIGKGEEKKNLENMVNELNLKANVHLLGSMSYSKVMQYLSICHIFLLPSYKETFGLVYLEAMMHKVVVIGCKGQGFDGIINNKENGFLVNPHSPNSIYEIIDYIIKNPLQSFEIALKGKLTAKNYTFEKIAMQVNKLYLEVIENNE